MKRSIATFTGLVLAALPLAAYAQHGHAVAHPTAAHATAHATTPATAPAAPAVAPVTLRYTYTAGQHVAYRSHSTQTLPAPIGAVTTDATLHLDTQSVGADGVATQHIRLDGLHLTGATLPAEVQQQVTSRLNGLTLDVRQDARGHVVSRQVPSTVTAEVRPMVEQVLAALDQLSPSLPEGPVAPGAVWHDSRTTHTSVGSNGTVAVTSNITYTLRAIRPAAGGGSDAVIGVSIAMSTGPGSSVQGMNVTMTGHADGEVVAALNHGAVRTSSVHGNYTMSLQAGSAAPMQVNTAFTDEMHAEGL